MDGIDNWLVQGGMDKESDIRERYAALAPTLDERQRRLWAGAEARAVGRGGGALGAGGAGAGGPGGGSAGGLGGHQEEGAGREVQERRPGVASERPAGGGQGP